MAEIRLSIPSRKIVITGVDRAIAPAYCAVLTGSHAHRQEVTVNETKMILGGVLLLFISTIFLASTSSAMGIPL